MAVLKLSCLAKIQNAGNNHLVVIPEIYKVDAWLTLKFLTMIILCRSRVAFC